MRWIAVYEQGVSGRGLRVEKIILEELYFTLYFILHITYFIGGWAFVGLGLGLELE